ncbi:MAG: hypothetical protein LUH42_00375 [Oscillospiraceae bacterium]|nr:hypothetical protein [Oscillospiraceae bacterium]
MRRGILGALWALLAGLVIARALLPTSARAQDVQAIGASSESYNLLTLDLSSSETAGSGMIGEMSDYFLSCTPTAKGEYTGLLAGKNLILICAASWNPTPDEEETPVLYRLWSEGARLGEVYAPDWYQDLDGIEFALLTGMTPTSLHGHTALAWTGQRGIYLPYALPTALADAGYTCLAFTADESREAAYQALGFDAVSLSDGTDIPATVAACAGEAPFFAYYVWNGQDCEPVLESLTAALEAYGLDEDTVICLLTGQETECRAFLFLWGAGLEGSRVETPCSELDAAPTLLNLLGIAYESRFLCGRDLFAAATDTGTASAAMPLVSLYGSAYSDWVTDAGYYSAQGNIFFLSGDWFFSDQEASRYVQQVRRIVYERYTFSRLVLEYNYFQVAFPSAEP